MRKPRFSALAFLAVIVAGAIAISVVGWRVNQQSQEIKTQRARLAQLTQQLCGNLSKSRIASNTQILDPLRKTEHVIADLARQSARHANGKRRHRLFRLARQFDKLAQQVTVAGPIQCVFKPDFGAAISAAPSVGATNIPNLFIQPSAGGTVTVIVAQPGSVITTTPIARPRPRPRPQPRPSPSPTCVKRNPHARKCHPK